MKNFIIHAKSFFISITSKAAKCVNMSSLGTAFRQSPPTTLDSDNYLQIQIDPNSGLRGVSLVKLALVPSQSHRSYIRVPYKHVQ
jgi:hypothetical protein